MSDLNALAQRIDALAAHDDVFEDGARVIAQGGTPAPLMAFLSVIDETVLERRLDFVADKSTISVIAAGRRLRGFLGVSTTTDDAADLIGATLSRQEPAILDKAFAVLSDVIAPAKHLAVRSLPAEPFGTTGERGVSASGLADIWQIDMDEAPLPPMSRFLRANEAAFTSVLHVSAGDILATEGDVAGLQSIWDTQVDTFLRAQKSLPSHKDGPKLICLEGALEGDDAAALALAGDDVALMVYDPAKLGALHASWQSIFQ
jgi:hypothetical protein